MSNDELLTINEALCFRVAALQEELRTSITDCECYHVNSEIELLRTERDEALNRVSHLQEELRTSDCECRHTDGLPIYVGIDEKDELVELLTLGLEAVAQRAATAFDAEMAQPACDAPSEETHACWALSRVGERLLARAKALRWFAEPQPRGLFGLK